MRALTELQIEVLNSLYAVTAGITASMKWATPLDLGGTDGSRHSRALTQLAAKGLVQFKQRGAPDPMEGENGAKGATRGAKSYRLTPAGLALAIALLDGEQC